MSWVSMPICHWSLSMHCLLAMGVDTYSRTWHSAACFPKDFWQSVKCLPQTVVARTCIALFTTASQQTSIWLTTLNKPKMWSAISSSSCLYATDLGHVLWHSRLISGGQPGCQWFRGSLHDLWLQTMDGMGSPGYPGRLLLLARDNGLLVLPRVQGWGWGFVFSIMLSPDSRLPQSRSHLFY